MLKKLLIAALLLALLGGLGAYWFLSGYDSREVSRLAFNDSCASCHGADLAGTAEGSPLIGTAQNLQTDVGTILADMNAAHAQDLLGNWNDTYSDTMIKALALFVSEQRQQFPTVFESQKFQVLQEQVDTRHHSFRVEHVTELQSGPYSMAPLPDGRILVVEKVRGLSIIDTDGSQGELIEATPRTWGAIAQVRGSYLGLGMMLDVELHPDYERNGWIYLSHSDRCQLDCNSLVPQTMVRVVRGRIRDNAWVDEEEIWSVHHDHYTVVPDGVACGRLAFDNTGHVYVSVGGKASYSNLHKLDTPFGKIHRVKDNGDIPEDNPFWAPPNQRDPTSTRHTVWSYGHRTSQGLAGHPQTGAIWNSEMGPRGGDELNLLLAGGNYGWPLYTKGIDYNGEPITMGEDLGLSFSEADTIAPVVDYTPAPALSNITFHNGEQFPHWRDDLLVSSLRAKTLYRVRVKAGVVVENEKLITDLGRIRDVEMGYDGLVYLLIEHENGGALVRLVPAN